jgi:hypothetical protein
VGARALRAEHAQALPAEPARALPGQDHATVRDTAA